MYWEGGYKGEGILRSLKPLMCHGVYTKKFAQHALTRYYNEKFISNILPPSIVSDTQGDNNYTYQRYNHLKTYPTVLSFQLEIARGAPVSIIILQDKKIGFSCMLDKKHVIIELIPDDDSGYEEYSTWVTTIGSLDEETMVYRGVPKTELKNIEVVKQYALLLSVHKENDTGESYYYVITDDWKERTVTGGQIQYVLPKIYSCAY